MHNKIKINSLSRICTGNAFGYVNASESCSKEMQNKGLDQVIILIFSAEQMLQLVADVLYIGSYYTFIVMHLMLGKSLH